jgi:shikimate kinase/3-dehydroquinate synthase
MPERPDAARATRPTRPRDSVVLVGLPGSGKSAVGACLAERTGRTFLDLDELITRRSGRTPTALITRDGEAAFRREEAAAIAEAATRPGMVLATGGGAVVDALNRWALWETGAVAWLDAPDEVLLARLEHDPVERPLLRGDASAALAALRASRAPMYAAADVRVDASVDPDAVSGALAAALDARQGAAHGDGRRLFDAEVRRDHPMGPPTARVLLGRDVAARAVGDVVARCSTGAPVVVVDARAAAALPELAAALPAQRRLTIRGGERAKRLRAVERLLEAASALHAERGDAWVAVGGGTTGDLVGTVAALYLRGAPLVMVPTTWLAQADASIGGKVAVDLSAAKNAAGAFWPPVAVIADVAALRSLPRARLLDGLAECLKAGLIGDAGLWDLVESRGRAALGPDEAARYAITERAVRLKLGVVDRDPFERGERRTLNLGHTIGHALEVESGYRLAHGQAVILGLRAAVAIAERRGAEAGLAERIDTVVGTLGYVLIRPFDPGAVRTALNSDKKRAGGRQRWILPMAVGSVVDVDDVTDAELHLALGRILATGAAR